MAARTETTAYFQPPHSTRNHFYNRRAEYQEKVSQRLFGDILNQARTYDLPLRISIKDGQKIYTTGVNTTDYAHVPTLRIIWKLLRKKLQCSPIC